MELRDEDSALADPEFRSTEFRAVEPAVAVAEALATDWSAGGRRLEECDAEAVADVKDSFASSLDATL